MTNKVSVKRTLAQSILDKIVAFKEANSNWAFNFKQAVVYVPELKPLIGANGIRIDVSGNRCKLQFVSIELGAFNQLKESVVTTFDKMDAPTRNIIADFINGLEAIGNVKPFEDCTEWLSRMKPSLDHYKTHLVGKSVVFYDGWANESDAAVIADVSIDTVNGKQFVRLMGVRGRDILVNIGCIDTLIAKGKAKITSECDGCIIVSRWYLT